MTAIARPNAWAAVEDTAAKLTYSPTVNPAPLTVSVPNRAPTLGSLVVVIGNDSGADVTVSSIVFTVLIGKKPGAAGNPLMTKPPAEVLVSEPALWSFHAGSEPSSGEGPMEFTLTPKPGTGPLQAGESVMVELIDFQTVEEASSSTVRISEEFSGGGEASLAIPTLPAGFFFDSLVATVEKGSAHTPVSEVDRGGKVVLLWSTSAAVGKQKIHYSNAATGEKVEPAKESGRWESLELTADTVFVVTVEETGAGGEALPAALTTAVAVRDPALVAHSLVAETLEATDAATVKGALEAGSAKVTGEVEAGSAKVTGEVEASSAKVTGEGELGSAKVLGKVATGELAASGASSIAGQFSLTGKVTTFGKPEKYGPGNYKAATDGFALTGRPQCLPVPCGYTLECPSNVGGFIWLPIGAGGMSPTNDATVDPDMVLCLAPGDAITTEGGRQ